MDENVKLLLEEVEESLKHLFENKLANIFLYGSYARDDFDEESDIDIIALVEEMGEKELKKYNEEIIELEIDLTIKYGIMPSIMVESKEYFMTHQNIEFLFQNVVKYGKTIYAA